MSDQDTTILTPQDKTTFTPDLVGLVGVFLNEAIDNKEAEKIADGGKGPTAEGSIAVDADSVKKIALAGQKQDDAPAKTTLAVIYGYIVESHFYRLPRPQIITAPGAPIALDDEAASAATGARKALYIWHVSPNERVATVLVEDGLVDDLILRANLPGGGGDGSYASKMQLGSYASKMQSGGPYTSKLQAGASFASKMQSGHHGG